MSTRSCVKFGVVIFLQLLGPTAFEAAHAQVNLNLETSTRDIAAPVLAPPIQAVQTEQSRPRNLHRSPKRHRAGHARQNR
jgi:hypothetical protein